MHKQFTILSKWQFENSYSYFSLLYKDFTIIDKEFKSHIILKALQKVGQDFIKVIFRKMILSKIVEK